MSLLPLVVGELIQSFQLESRDRALAAGLAHNASRAIAANVGRLIEDSRNQVEQVATRPGFGGPSHEPIAEALAEMLELQPRFSGAATLDSSGRVVAAAKREGKPSYPTFHAAPWFQQLQRDQATVMTEAEFGQVTHRWVCALATPIRNPAAGPANAPRYLGASLDLESVANLLSSFEFDSSATITIVSRLGRIVAHIPRTPDWIGRDISATPLGRLSAMGPDARGTIMGLEGVRQVYGTARIPWAGWTVAVGIPERAVLADARRRLIARLGLLAAGIAAAMALAVLATGSIARPIAALQVATEAAAGGGSRIEVRTDGPREIAGVALSFNRMMRMRADTEDSLRRSERTAALGALVAGVAHEIRGPLFGLQSSIEALAQRAADTPVLTRYLPHLRRDFQRMDRLTSDLLDYGRDLRLDPIPVPVPGLLEGAAAHERPEATARDVRIEVVVHGTPPPVLVDPQRGLDLLTNLIDNAVRLSIGGTVVTVEARAAQLEGSVGVEIAVLDQGRGLAPEDLPRVFEPFFSRREGGTGIGLALVRRLVEEHGGTVTAANREGGGARFTVWLPAGEAT